MTTPIDTKNISQQEGYKHFIAECYKEADHFTSYFVIGYFVLGFLLAPFYDTWLFAFCIGGCSLAAWVLCRFFAPGTVLSRIVTSLVFASFVLQFIGQMHGMYEMHFFFFINIAILIIYQNWRVMVPYILFATIYHIVLFGMQLRGYDVGEYIVAIDSISYTTVFFHLLLMVLMGVICSWWSFVLQKRSQQDFYNKDTLKKQLTSMEKNIAFAGEISQGNLKAEYELQEGDRLGASLLEMRKGLLEASAKEEQERFKNVGLTEIGEILRKNADNLNELAYQTVSKIVKYMNINQGGLFILNDDENTAYLELVASYAFNKKKYLTKQIEIGEGLTGMAVLEKETVLLTDIPQDYINITSGLGSATPRSIVIIPLKTSSEAVVGVMEFASFHIFQPHEIQFLEKLAENIAAAITSAKVNQHTRILLEKSQQQAEELRAQEEEMRQSMEELEATQEEMHRKEIEMRGQITATDNTLATIEFGMNGIIRAANDNMLQALGYSLNEIRGKHHRIFCEAEYASSAEYAEFWQKLNDGISFTSDFKRIGKGGKDLWLHASYTPVMDAHNRPIKVIKLAFDITEEKMHNLDMQGQIEAVNNSNAVIEFSPQGKILRANFIFQDLMGYGESDLIGKHHKLFVDAEEQASSRYQQHWDRLQEGEILQGEFKRINKRGKDIWIKGTYNPVYDLNGRVVKVVKIAQDITAEKLLQQQAQLQIQEMH